MAFLAPKPIASLIFVAHDEYGRDKARADDFFDQACQIRRVASGD
jgi:hypothetical protein